MGQSHEGRQFCHADAGTVCHLHRPGTAAEHMQRRGDFWSRMASSVHMSGGLGRYFGATHP